MPKPGQSGKKRFFYNLNIKRTKSNQKAKKLINHIVFLAKKIDEEGITPWTSAAIDKAQAKLDKHRFNSSQVTKALEHKNLAKLDAIVSEHFIFSNDNKAEKLASRKPREIKKNEEVILKSKAPAAKKPAATKSTAAKTTTTKKTTTAKAPAAKKPAATKSTAAKTTTTKKTTTAKAPAAKKPAATKSTAAKTTTTKKTTTAKAPAAKKPAASADKN